MGPHPYRPMRSYGKGFGEYEPLGTSIVLLYLAVTIGWGIGGFLGNFNLPPSTASKVLRRGYWGEQFGEVYLEGLATTGRISPPTSMYLGSNVNVGRRDARCAGVTC